MNEAEKRTLILAFMSWLETKEMCVAGYVFNGLLGTNVLAPLHEDDVTTVLDDFIKESAA